MHSRTSHYIRLHRLDRVGMRLIVNAHNRPTRRRVWPDPRHIHYDGFVPGTKVLLLSRTTKMPGPSWSLPAVLSCPFMVTGPNTICGSCYVRTDLIGDGTRSGGRKNNQYNQPVVRNAQAARWEWTKRCMRSPAGVDEFVSTLVDAIQRGHVRYFRVHDSGDLFSPTYTCAWIRIAKALPDVHFWIPTRSWQAPWVGFIRQLAGLSNVAVRPSALYFGTAVPTVEGLAAGTSADKNYTCPAPKQGNRCGECRTCWDRKEIPVVYHAH